MAELSEAQEKKNKTRQGPSPKPKQLALASSTKKLELPVRALDTEGLPAQPLGLQCLQSKLQDSFSGAAKGEPLLSASPRNSSSSPSLASPDKRHIRLGLSWHVCLRTARKGPRRRGMPSPLQRAPRPEPGEGEAAKRSAPRDVAAGPCLVSIPLPPPCGDQGGLRARAGLAPTRHPSQDRYLPRENPGLLCKTDLAALRLRPRNLSRPRFGRPIHQSIYVPVFLPSAATGERLRCSCLRAKKQSEAPLRRPWRQPKRPGPSAPRGSEAPLSQRGPSEACYMIRTIRDHS